MVETTQENWQRMCPHSANTYELRVRLQEDGDFFRIRSQHKDGSPYTQHIKGKGKGKSGLPRTSPSTYPARGAPHMPAREYFREHARERFDRDYSPYRMRGRTRDYTREPLRERAHEPSRDVVRERPRAHDRAPAQELEREYVKEPISEHAVEAARALLREHERELARERERERERERDRERERERVLTRARPGSHASTVSRDPAHGPSDCRHPRDRDVRTEGRMESRRSAYAQHRDEEEVDEPPAKHRRMSPPVPSECGRYEPRRSRYDRFDRRDPYARHEQHSQHEYRSQSSRSPINEPAAHSAEPHMASHLPA